MVKQIITFAFLLMGPLMAQQAPVVPYPVNALNTDEAEVAYELLWDGTADGFFNHWHAYREHVPTSVWETSDNAPLGPRIQNLEGERASILSKNTYTNFDLKFDVAIPIDGYSGVFVRYQEEAVSEFNSRSGPKLQICGPANLNCFGPLFEFGACHDIKGVRPEVKDTWQKPIGEWNQLRIIAYQDHIVHYGNGIKLLEYEIGSKEFMEAYGNSRYVHDGSNGNYFNIHEGSILLQHHGEFDSVSFRNLKIKDLGEPDSALDFGNPKEVVFGGYWPDTLPHWYALGKPFASPIHKDSPNSTRGENLTFQVQGQLPLFLENENFTRIEIMDIRGNTIKSMPITSNEIFWNKATSNGRQAEPGFYLVRFVGDKVGKQVKMVLLSK